MNYVKINLVGCFPEAGLYNRFTELMQTCVYPVDFFQKICCTGKSMNISHIGSTIIIVCRNKWNFCRRLFGGFVQRGKTTKWYFYGFKLHNVVNDKGEIPSFALIAGNPDDEKLFEDKNLFSKIKVKLYENKVNCSKLLIKLLFIYGLHLITHVWNIKMNVLIEMRDKIHLGKRSFIDIINDELKKVCSILNVGPRSFGNILTYLLSDLISDSHFLIKQPSGTKQFYQQN